MSKSTERLSVSRPGTSIKKMGSRVTIIEGPGTGESGTLEKFHKVCWPGRFLGKDWVGDEGEWIDTIDSSGKIITDYVPIVKQEYRTRVGIKLDNGTMVWSWYWDCEIESNKAKTPKGYNWMTPDMIISEDTGYGCCVLVDENYVCTDVSKTKRKKLNA